MSHISLRRSTSILIASSLLVASGCNVNPSREQVVGRYVLKGEGDSQIVLSLAVDGTFTETIIRSQTPQSLVGRWWLKDGDLDFDRLWIPAEFAPNDVVEQDKRTEPGHPKYTGPGHWDAPVEKWWGRMEIEIFPDEDVQFVMISRT